MNRQISDGQWRELKGKIKERWGNIAEDELEKTKGNIDQIAGKVQQQYGESLDEARAKINGFLKSINEKIS